MMFNHTAGPESLRSGPMLYIKLVATAIFWGGTFVAGRSVAAEAAPFSAAFLRFVVASFFLLIFSLRSYGRIPLPDVKQLFPVLLLGLTGVFAYNAFFFSGLKTVTASRASVIIAANPACIALLSSWFLRERLGPGKILGIALSISGAVLVVSKGAPATLFRGGAGMGELYIFGCVLSWGVYSVIGKTVMTRLSPLLAVTYACIIGAVCLFWPALVEGLPTHINHYTSTLWLGISYLGFFGSALGFIWYYEGIKVIGPSRAGVFINIVPISSIVLAHWILHESIDVSLVGGAALIIIGVYATNRSTSYVRYAFWRSPSPGPEVAASIPEPPSISPGGPTQG
jgi:drug/metabolite transporter (DMT)-like permease